MKKVLILLAFIVLVAVVFFVLQNINNSPNNFSKNSNLLWEFDSNNKAWKTFGNPPPCPDPLVIDPPVDVSLASSILYPGQYRTGGYKPHGGFRFDNTQDNSITVAAPMDGFLYKGSRHPSDGEIQYVLYFINDCGILYKLDHLLTLTPKFKEIIEKIPMGGEGDSRTTNINPAVFVAKGEVVATEVGLKDFQGARNVFFDFGLYDVRKNNKASEDPNYATNHKGEEEFSFTALCWLENLSEPSYSIVKNLPNGDQEGKASDYCS